MSTFEALGFLVIGIVLLGIGGEVLVRGATAVARLARLSPAVIGLTVVAMGTSLPELAVSVAAALRGSPEVAVGNVVGSNIANITLVVGLTGLLAAIPVSGKVIRLEWPFMFLSSFLALLLARDGYLDQLEGGFFLVSLALFLIYVVRLARREVTPAERERYAGEIQQLSRGTQARGVAINLGLVLFGVGFLVAGAQVMVLGAIDLAQAAGVSERVIGLTVVAVGTSLPEVAASAVAAYRNQTEMALANAIGSNIFNVLGILGVTALLKPVPVAHKIVTIDMWWMLALSLLLFPAMRTRHRVAKKEGAVLLAGYGIYILFLVLTGLGS
ncbi:MAG: calcium/sodium antiporter [Gemmatimonadales bacterium]